MFSPECLKGYYKDKKLSDRYLKIVEIKDDFDDCSGKRKHQEEGIVSSFLSCFLEDIKL